MPTKTDLEIRYGMVEALTKLPAFIANSGVTHCNSLVQAVSFLWGCDELKGMMIRDMHLYISKSPMWVPRDINSAHLAAECGGLVLALWSDPKPFGDHGCIVIPGDRQWSESWEMKVPICANVGKTNFYGKKLSYAFTKEQMPEFYAWAPSI